MMHCQAQAGRDNSPASFFRVRVATNLYSEGLTDTVFVDDCVVHGEADKVLPETTHDWTDEETWALITTCDSCALLHLWKNLLNVNGELPLWENLLNTNSGLLRVTSNSTQER
jgi:hypothetical protein